MTLDEITSKDSLKDKPYLLAMHSSSDVFGVGILDLRSPIETLRSSTFPIGRKLSNEVFNCIETVLPKSHWAQVARVSVATGPGGFTGTRISVIIARILGQQLKCSVDGISSFYLMAHRVSKNLRSDQKNEPFWIVKEFSRGRIIGGKYIENPKKCNNLNNDLIELESPKIIEDKTIIENDFDVEEDIEKDTTKLLDISYALHKSGKESHWSEALPIYLTSPVSNS